MESIEQSSDSYRETWTNFGKNLETYIKTHKEELEKDNFDVILGFSRGGTILAYAFACLLKDIIPQYSKLAKASVRSIPKGITCKREDPCFVMDRPASTNESKDITITLQKDLEEFSKSKNGSEPISVLIMDDNLTGATRVNFLEEVLGKMSCIKLCKKLAYVRHPAFLPIPTMTTYPEGKKYFTMPWHMPHEKKNLNVQSNKPDLVKLKFHAKVSNEFNLQKLLDKLNDEYGIKKNLVINGASVFILNKKKIKDDNFLEINLMINYFYPPKSCLNSNHSNNGAFDKLSLCSLGANKSMGCCVVCSCMYCNLRLIQRLVSLEKIQTISVKTGFRKKEIDMNLKLAIKEWFKISMPTIELLDN